MSTQQHDLSTLNWDNLRRNQFFQKGNIKYPEEYVDEKVKGKTVKKFRNFKDLPSVSPVMIREEVSELIVPSERKNEENKFQEDIGGLLKKNSMDMDIQKELEKQKQLVANSEKANPEIDLNNQDNQKHLLAKMEIISHEKIIYTKPIAIIYNPNSGKKRDIRHIIEEKLNSEKIPFEILESTRRFHTWELAENLEIDKYCALVAVGGDGTFHEVVNGMMHRKDKKRIPVAFIPNGSGNDTLRSYNVFDIVTALDYIVKGDVIKVDITKMLMDHEDEKDVPLEDRNSKLRYQVNNSCFSLPARVNLRAIGWKKCCCNPYQIAALLELCSLKYDLYDIYIDDVLVLEDQISPMVMAFLGKYAGNGFLLNPIGVINNGCNDFLVVAKKYGAKNIAKIMDDSLKQGGIHIYDPNVLFFRGKNAKVVNKNPIKAGTKEPVMKHFVIDGEDLYYEKFVKYECEYQGLEVIVDFDLLMQSQGHFTA